MKNLKILLIILLPILFANGAYAKKASPPIKKEHNHSDHKHDHKEKMEATVAKNSNDLLVVKVKGMVCSFCAQGIEKHFNEKKQVKSTKVDLDKMEVTVKLKPKQNLSEEEIKQIVTSAGFAYQGVKK